MKGVVTVLVLIIALALIGVAICRVDDSLDYQDQLKENELIREQLKQKMDSVESLRIAISEQRKLYEQEITKSNARFHKLQSEFKKNENRYKHEIERLGKSNVKELEDEAERIYSAVNKH